MFLTMDALADGGVWAGIPKELSLKLIAHTMFVSSMFIAVLRHSKIYVHLFIPTHEIIPNLYNPLI